MVVNDKEKESLFNEPRDDKPTDSGSSHKKRDGKRRDTSRRSSTMTVMHHLLHQGTTTTPHPRKRRLIKTIPLIILVFRIIRMPIYFLFLLENPHTLMERITHFGAIKCVVIYFLSILAFGKLWKMGRILIVRIILCLLMNKFIKMPKLLLSC
jgi:lysylphosphatidylglycerol synthetase-like protein (DUF2156 family)